MNSLHLYVFDGRNSEAVLEYLNAGWKFTYNGQTNKLTEQYNGVESFLKSRYLLR